MYRSILVAVLVYVSTVYSYSINPVDVETPPLKTLYKWKQIDFEFESDYHKEKAISDGSYIPENVIPLGVERWKDRVFVTLPKWKNGVPATLASLPVNNGGEISPLMRPYPSWNWHNKTDGDCTGIWSVFRITIDPCGRLWVLDSGKVDLFKTPRQACPPKLLLIDLNTDKVLAQYHLPKDLRREGTLYSNIVVDTRSANCRDAFVYMADAVTNSLLIFNFRHKNFWRLNHKTFNPDPEATDYSVHGVNFNWKDGIFGLSLSPVTSEKADRTLYYHAMSSFKEYSIKTSLLRNPQDIGGRKAPPIGEDRGPNGQVSAAAIDRNGVMFFNLVSKDAIGCWDTRKPYIRSNLHIIAQNAQTLLFPNDLRIDNEPDQSVWIITNKLTHFQFNPLNANEYNYRLMYMNPKEAIRGTVCDPNVA